MMATVSLTSTSTMVAAENNVLVALSSMASVAVSAIVGASLTDVTVITVTLSVTGAAVPSFTEIWNVVATVPPTATWFTVGVKTIARTVACASAGVSPVTL